MLWRDLAGRLYGLVCRIDRYREPGHYVGVLGEPIDPIIEDLEQIRQDVQDCSAASLPDLRPLQGRAGSSNPLADRGATDTISRFKTEPTGGGRAPPRGREDDD